LDVSLFDVYLMFNFTSLMTVLQQNTWLIDKNIQNQKNVKL